MRAISTFRVGHDISRKPQMTWTYYLVQFMQPQLGSIYKGMQRTAKVKTVNDVRQIQALIDKKKLIITETRIRSDLHLEDARVFINQQLGDMSHHKKIYVNPSHTKKIFANMKREGKDFSRRITPLFDTMMKKQKSKRKQRKEAEVAHDEAEHEESVPTSSNDPLPSEKAKFDQAIEITSLKKRVYRLEKRRKFRTTGLKRLKKVGAARRIESSSDSSGAQEDASKQRRRIEDIDVDAEVTLVNETQEREYEDLMFDTRVLDSDEMFMDATTGEKDEQSTKIDDSTAGEAVTTASAAPTIQVSIADIGDEGVTAARIDELTLAQTLIKIKADKPKVIITAATTTTTTRPKARGVVIQEPSEFRTSPEAQPSKSKDKDAEIIEEERLKRQKQEEDNITLVESWENTQAMMEADRLVAEILQTREREELTNEEKGKLFMELMEKR
ncbi:hypothetical protein Tco_1343863 [Tanacetum coccineum]